MAALFERERSGKGRYLEVAMLDSLFSMMLTGLSRLLYMGETPARVGNRHPESYPVDLFSTKTGDVVLVVPNDAVFAVFAKIIGRPELADDARFKNYAERSRNDDALRPIIADWARSLTAEEVIEMLGEASIPCAPVWSLDRVADSDHARQRNLVIQGRHATLGAVPVVPQPVRFSDVEAGEEPIMPLLGEHTEAVLRDVLGMNDADVKSLADKNVI
jgi:CoA:oxalate CoA-transferase